MEYIQEGQGQSTWVEVMSEATLERILERDSECKDMAYLASNIGHSCGS